MRPSGFSWRWDRTKCSPTIRAPWMAPGSFAIAASRRYLPTYLLRSQKLAGLLGPLGLDRSRIHRRGPLQVADLLLQRVNLGLLVIRLGRGGELGRREPVGRAAGGLSLSGAAARHRLVLVQALHFLLQDAHRLAQGARRVRQLLRSEQHDDHDGDDQDLPWAVEQVTKVHERPL